MNDMHCYLVTVCDGKQLLKCALKTKRDLLLYRACFSGVREMLPMHVQSFGTVVDVERIFEIEVEEEE